MFTVIILELRFSTNVDGLVKIHIFILTNDTSANVLLLNGLTMNWWKRYVLRVKCFNKIFIEWNFSFNLTYCFAPHTSLRWHQYYLLTWNFNNIYHISFS